MQSGTEMPFFIKPSVTLSDEDKVLAYNQLSGAVKLQLTARTSISLYGIL